MALLFERDRVRFNSSSIPTACVDPNQSQSHGSVINLSCPQRQQQQQQQKRIMFVGASSHQVERDTCFLCKEIGHWAKDCAQKSPYKQPSSSLEQQPSNMNSPNSKTKLVTDGLQYTLSLVCLCGVVCPIFNSTSVKNPGRPYYRCSSPNSETRCKFFQWVDKVRSEDMIYVPDCSCHAGLSRLTTEIDGPNAGRKYFICPIRKGQGACNFFRWLDPLVTTSGAVDENFSSPRSTLVNGNDTCPANRKLVDEVDLSCEGVEIGTPAEKILQCSQNDEAIAGQSKRGKRKAGELEGEEDESNEPPTKHCKWLKHGDPNICGSILDSDTDCVDMSQATLKNPVIVKELQALVQRSEAEIQRRPVWRQISVADISLPADPCSSVVLGENWFVVAAANQSLGLHTRDWLGRLAYPPSRCLTMHAPKPFFCCVFPSLDPIFPCSNVDRFDGEPLAIPPESPLPAENNNVSLVSRSQNAKLSSTAYWELSSPRSLTGMSQGYVMRGAISECFEQLALQFENKLLTLLESMDFSDHESMAQEANTTFVALDQLNIDHRPFRERVREFISRASCLTQIELTIRNDQSSKELVDLCNYEKQRLDDLSREHAEVMANLEASRARLRLLGEDAIRVRQMLLRIETELADCKTETQDLEARFSQISIDVVETEKGFQNASKAAEGALKLCQLREDDRHAAEAAFEKARMLLRRLILSAITS